MIVDIVGDFVHRQAFEFGVNLFSLHAHVQYGHVSSTVLKILRDSEILSVCAPQEIK